MTKVLKTFYLIIFLFLFSICAAQENIGLQLGRHNGISGTYLNPANSLNSASDWSIQIVGLHSFAQTNYGYINNTNLFKLIKNYEDVVFPQARDEIIQPSPTMTAIFNVSTNSNFNTVSGVYGPGFLLKVNDVISAGFSMRVRAHVGIPKIPVVANYYNFKNINRNQIYNLTEFHMSGLAWTEYIFHFAKQTKNNLSLGINFKYLQGLETFMASNDQSFNFLEADNGSKSVLDNGQFTFNYTDYEDRTRVKGHGLGFDIGISIRDLLLQNSRLGVSLIDVGFIQFKGSQNTYTFTPFINFDDQSYENIENLNELNTQLAQDFELLNSNEKIVSYIPTALSLQYNIALQHNINIEAQWTQRLSLGKHHIIRPNSSSISAYFEKKHFSFFLPVTFYDYSKIHLGAALRLGYLTIGSDDITSLFGSNNFDGYDLYMKINLYPFKLRSKNKTPNSEINCYSF